MYARETPSISSSREDNAIAISKILRDSLSSPDTWHSSHSSFSTGYRDELLVNRHSTVVDCIAGIRLPGARLSTCDHRVGRSARNIYREDNRERKRKRKREREREKGEGENDKRNSFVVGSCYRTLLFANR